jgi:Protein of unknown function (DUF1360)
MSESEEGLARPFEGYSEEDMPLGAYAALTALFGSGFGAVLMSAARSGRLPEDVSLQDVLLLGTAAHKVSRIVARDRVTAFLRAPFTRYEGPAHINEVNEQPRGEGFRRSVGELMACPLCLAVWVGGALFSGYLVAPRATRVIAALFTSLTIADSLHLAYASALQKAE